MTVISRCWWVVMISLAVLSPVARTPAFAQSDAVRAQALIGLVRVERDVSRFEPAADAFHEATRLHVFDETLLVEFFWTIVHVDEAEAAALGQLVLAMNPAEANVRDRLIELATQAGDEARALLYAYAEEGARLEPKRALWHRRMGESLLRSGAPARAARAFDQALAAAGAVPADAAQHALALEAAGVWPEAWHAWAPIPEALWSSRPEWARSRFRAMAATHAPAEVAPLVARHLTAYPADPELQAQLVEAWAAAGRPDLTLDALAPCSLGRGE